MCNKFELYHFLCEKYPPSNPSDSTCHLINSIEDVEKIYKIYPYESKKLFYFMKNDIHKLFYEKDYVFKFYSYDLEKVLPENSDKIKLSELFYLESLIKDSPEIINYSLDIDYIELINNKLFNLKNKPKNCIQYAITAKFILLLIDNYLNDTNDENFENINKLESIKEKSIKLIEETIKENRILIKLNYKLDDILDKNIDEIYLNIILYLIQNNKFSYFDDAYEIIKDLDLENISLTQNMYEGISQALDEKNEYLEYYEIENLGDINESKINFYYIIIKFILKNTIYIYNIPFLKKNFMKIINYKDIFILIPQNRLYHKMIYFFSIYSGFNINIITYNKTIQTIPADNTFEIVTPVNATKNEKELNSDDEIYEEHISKENSNQTLKDNESEIIDIKNYIYQINNKCAQEILNNITIILTPDKDNKNCVTYRIKEVIANKNRLKIRFFKNLLNNLDTEDKNTYETYKNYELLLQFIEDIKEYISINELNYTPDIKLEFIKENAYNDKYFDDDKYKYIYNITCVSSFVVDLEGMKKKEYKFKDYDVLINGIDEDPNGFVYLINELCNEEYKCEKEDD